MFKVIKQTIKAGQPAHLVSFHGEHPEPYSDEQLEILKKEQVKEVFGLVVCSIFITFIFFGLILIL